MFREILEKKRNKLFGDCLGNDFLQENLPIPELDSELEYFKLWVSEYWLHIKFRAKLRMPFIFKLSESELDGMIKLKKIINEEKLKSRHEKSMGSDLDK